MGDRHGDEADVVGRPLVPVDVRRLHDLVGFDEVGVRQHRAFRAAGGARGVELDRDVFRPISATFGRRIGCGVAPGFEGLPLGHAAFHGDDLLDLRRFFQNFLRRAGEFRADEEHRRARNR